MEAQVAGGAALKDDVGLLKRLLAEGRGGAPGPRWVDTRIMEKPSKFFGKSADWKDSAESFVAFCSAEYLQVGHVQL